MGNAQHTGGRERVHDVEWVEASQQLHQQQQAHHQGHQHPLVHVPPPTEPAAQSAVLCAASLLGIGDEDLAPAAMEEAEGATASSSAPQQQQQDIRCGGYLPTDFPQQQQQEEEDDEVQIQVQLLMPQLPPGPIMRALEHLPAQDQACSGRLACKDAWRHLSGAHQRTARLSEPLLPHAVPWFERYGGEALREMRLADRAVIPMCAAAASGSEANLAAVWGLVCQGKLPGTEDVSYPGGLDVGVVLVQQGHTHLLPWLLERGCPFNASRTLLAAARYCDLAGFRTACELLSPQCGELSTRFRLTALEAAAESPSSSDSVAKMEWLLQEGIAVGGPVGGHIPPTAAAAAVRTGDLVRLRWMRQRGCHFTARRGQYNMLGLPRRYSVLPAALEFAGLEVAEWLLREARCRLPGSGAARAAGATAHNPSNTGRRSRKGWSRLAEAAAASGDVGKLRWLQDRGMPWEVLSGGAAAGAVMRAAVQHGRVDVVRYLQEECGQQGLRDASLAEAAVGSGSVDMAAWVMQQGGRELFTDRAAVWGAAARSGNLDLVRWLVDQGMFPEAAGAAVGVVRGLVQCWPRRVQQDDWRQASLEHLLLPAVQLVGQAAQGNDSSGESSGMGGRGVAADSDELPVDAARRGSLPLFAYLHSYMGSPPLGFDVLRAATGEGCEALLEWLLLRYSEPYSSASIALTEGNANAKNLVQLLFAALPRGDTSTLLCFQRMGVPWPPWMLLAAVSWDCPLRMLQWLVEHGASTDVGVLAMALDVAKRFDNGDVEAWLRGLVEVAVVPVVVEVGETAGQQAGAAGEDFRSGHGDGRTSSDGVDGDGGDELL